MANNKVIIIGEKETFLIRVIRKKMDAESIRHVFTKWDIDDINGELEGTDLVIVYMDDNVLPHEDIIHFLNDKMDETGMCMIPIGEKSDVAFVCDHVSPDNIYKTFIRPVDNDALINSITMLFVKMEAGEFKKSILVVDDDPNYLGLVREWLKDTYKVSMANSGLQAIKWLGKNRVDLILLDHEMPVTSGPRVLEMLRSDEETKDIPVMFLTGKSDKKSVMEVVALKPEGYFLKTIKREELLEQLKEFFVLHR